MTAMTWIRNNLKVAVPGAIVLVAVFAFLAFGVFGIHTKFIDDEVAESGPVFASGANASGLPSDDVSDDITDEMNDVMEEQDTPLVVAADDPMPEADDPMPEAADPVPEADDPMPEADEAASAEAEDAAEAAAPIEVLTLVQGSFVDRSHPGSGIAKVLNDGSEQRFLRFEDFETDNGPDLFVYLTRADAAADAGAFGIDGDFVNLGRLKGNVGEQNYEIPADVDLGEFDTVVVWCDRFSVAFTAADLA